MLVFLTLLYCGLLFVLVKLGVIKLNLFWKTSPVLYMTVLFIVLFIPMQWGAPSGPVNVYQPVVEVIPNVSGEVIEVPIDGLQNLKEGDVLFKIDPTPFQDQVDQCRAQLANAEQTVLQLNESVKAAKSGVEKVEADVELAKANQVAADATVKAAKALVDEEKGKREKTIAVAEDIATQLASAKKEYDRVKELFQNNAASASDVDLGLIKYTGLQSQFKAAEADIRVAEDTIVRAQADLSASEARAKASALSIESLENNSLPRAKANLRQAELAANSMIGDDHTLVATAKAQLAKAEFELTETVVRAPGDGYVIGASLRPGQRVANFPVRSWMSFVLSEETRLVVGIPQHTLRYVRPGQKAEVTFKLLPGRTFNATVDEIAYATEQGQVSPSGILVSAPDSSLSAVPFGVRLNLDRPPELEHIELPGGAIGTAAIYTEKVKIAHVIRKVMVRMEAWKNYVIPW